MSTSIHRVLVLGGTGSVGREVVAHALEHDLSVRVLTRDPERSRGRFAENVELVTGSFDDVASLASALEDVDAVIMTHGAPYGSGKYEEVDYGAVPALLEALDGRTVRVALMSSIGATGGEAGPDLLTWKRRGERLLRASGLPYTVIRPGWFDGGSDADRHAELRQGDRVEYGSVRRADLAEALVQAVLLPEAEARTVELFSAAGDPLTDWSGAFQATAADVDGQLDGVEDRRNLPLDREPQRIREDLERFGSH